MELLLVFVPRLRISPQVYLIYIKINYRSVVYNLCIMLMITNIETQMGIYLKEKD